MLSQSTFSSRSSLEVQRKRLSKYIQFLCIQFRRTLKLCFGKRREEEQERNREKKYSNRTEARALERVGCYCAQCTFLRGLLKVQSWLLALEFDVSYSNLYSTSRTTEAVVREYIRICSSYTVMLKKGEVKIYEPNIFLLHSKDNDLSKTVR